MPEAGGTTRGAAIRILLVEDDARVASFIRRGLKEAEGYAVDVVRDGETALFQAQTESYDLIILDLLLPKRSGMDVLTTLRGDKLTTPVLILTAKDDLQDKVKGLEAGADDYLTKPFGFEELLARVRALLRRRGSLTPTVLRVGDLEMDTLQHRVTRAGRDIPLTTREYALLEYLLRHANEVVSRTMLSEHVWEHDFDSFSNVIDVHIARLRRKIDEEFSPPLLQTIRGRGYCLQDPNAHATAPER
jgi:DNA-binding response OmpR family regulator